MWSSDLKRRSFLFASLATLSACQFRPAFAPGSPSAALFENVAFQTPNSSDSFALVDQLEKRLGRGDAPQWRLGYTISTSSQSFSGSDARRIQLSGNARFDLAENGGENRRITGNVSGFVTYTEARTSATNTGLMLSNRTAEQDARDRLMILLADRMVDRMVVDIARTKA